MEKIYIKAGVVSTEAIDFLYDHVPKGHTWNKMAGTWTKEYIENIRKEIRRDSKTVKYVDNPNVVPTYYDPS